MARDHAWFFINFLLTSIKMLLQEDSIDTKEFFPMILVHAFRDMVLHKLDQVVTVLTYAVLPVAKDSFFGILYHKIYHYYRQTDNDAFNLKMARVYWEVDASHHSWSLDAVGELFYLL